MTNRLAVIGLGYVGLPLAVHFAERGFNVIGFDLDDRKLARLNRGESYLSDVSSNAIQSLMKKGNFRVARPNKTLMRQADAIIIAVPTPILNERPDLSAVIAATRFVAEQLRTGQTIVLESTTYPGTLEEVMLPILNESGLVVGKDFYLGYSPERIDPGNKDYALREIPKVVSGQTDACLQKTKALYEAAFDQVVPVSSPRVAEMCKLFENIQRLVNISLVNEINHLCLRLGIDFREALRAAATKPFGFAPYWPGPGIGGHCIPVDPIYFQWKAKKQGLSSQLVEQALRINRQMPQLVTERAIEALADVADKQAKILLIGLAYKKDVNDLRESPALDIFQRLLERGYVVQYCDPHVPSIELNGQTYRSSRLSVDLLDGVDLVIVLTDHSSIDWPLVKNNARRIIDTRGVFDKL